MSRLTYASTAIDDLPQLWDGFAKLVREGMGIAGFGAQIMDLPPDYTTKSHDESDSGQEELYVALRGSGAVIVHGDADERLPLDPDHVVAVGPAHARTLTSGSDGLRVLCIGGTPGQPYEPPGWTTGG
jgi:mannose-6-phosphate isomerase-like protein (cupin superfamily)